MVKIDSVLDQLTRIHYEYENWHDKNQPKSEVKQYISKVIKKGRLLVYVSQGEVLGYVESWRLDYDQWGKIVCHESFSPCDQEVNFGPIAYVANVWIHPDHRRSNVFKMLYIGFMQQNWNAKYFVGVALRKKTQPIKVLTKKDVYDKYMNKHTDVIKT